MDRNEIYDIHGYEVLDRDGNSLGEVTGFWVDETTRQPEFASVKTGFLMGKNHVIPIRDARFDYGGEKLRVPYAEEVIKDAPAFEPDQDLSPAEEARVYAHYRLDRAGLGNLPRRGTGTPKTGVRGRDVQGTAEIPLREEKVNVGKRDVGGETVRLKKVVKTETKEVPVELRRERIDIERVPATQMKGTFTDRPWTEEEFVLRATREEPVVNKTERVTGGVRATMDVETEERDVRAPVRREEVEVDRDQERLGRRDL